MAQVGLADWLVAAGMVLLCVGLSFAAGLAVAAMVLGVILAGAGVLMARYPRKGIE